MEHRIERGPMCDINHLPKFNDSKQQWWESRKKQEVWKMKKLYVN